MTAAALPANYRTLRDRVLPVDFVDVAINILLMVFLIFFYVGSKFTLAGLPVRVEDMIFLALAPMSYRYINRPKAPLFYWVAAYFAINLIPYAAEMGVGEYSLSFYPIIVAKELEFLYIAYLVCAQRSRLVFATVDVLAVFIIAVGIKSIINREITYYGIGTFGAYEAPSLAGAIFFFSAVWLHIRSRLLPSFGLRLIALGVAVAGGICAIATISRSTMAGMVLYMGTYVLFSSPRLVPWLVGFVAAIPVGLQWAANHVFTTWGYFAAQILHRVLQISEAAGVRSQKWKDYLARLEPLDWVFGRGKGWPNALDKTLGLGIDNQYVRIILENGIVGLLILAVIFGIIVRETRRRGGEYPFVWAVLAAMVMMSVPLESLQVSKSGGFFWLIMFYLLMCQRKPRVNHEALRSAQGKLREGSVVDGLEGSPA